MKNDKVENNVSVTNIVEYVKKKNFVERIIMFLCGIFLYAFSFSVFFNTNNIVVGGASGLSMIVNKFTNIDNSLFVLLFSLFVLILGYISLGFKDIIKTICGVILLPLLLEFTSYFPMILNIEIHSMFMVVFIGGIFMGFGNGCIIKSGFSCGGIQTICKILYKCFRIGIGKSNFICNGILVIIGGFIFGTSNMAYAIIGLYVSSVVTDKVLLETSLSKTFYIVTERHKEICQYITDIMGHSVTIMDGKGGYSNDNKKILMCDVPTREYFVAKEVIRDIDKKCFFLILDTYEIRGGM